MQRVFFRCFWKKLKTPKRHFEINWPLILYLGYICFSSEKKLFVEKKKWMMKINDKIGDNILAENTTNTLKVIQLICPIGPKVWDIVGKRLHWESIVLATKVCAKITLLLIKGPSITLFSRERLYYNAIAECEIACGVS